MNKRVHLLWFVANDDELLIGVYEAESDAKAAIERLKNKPGFVGSPGGFEIHWRELGQNSWTEGFVKQ